MLELIISGFLYLCAGVNIYLTSAVEWCFFFFLALSHRAFQS